MPTCFSSAPAGDFRSKRKCLGTSVSLLLLAFFLLLVTPETIGRPHDDSPPLDEGFVVSDEYGEVDNVEYHHARIVDGVLQEDHPVIMYKEDFVSEDFDPTKNRNGTAVPHKVRKYKDIAHRRRRVERPDSEQYRALKPEKIYFDILSPAPIVVAEDVAGKRLAKGHVEVISLADDNDVNPNAAAADADDSKQVLKKRPKKYNRRQRRDTGAHAVHKRNPYLRYKKPAANSIAPSRSYLPASAAQDNAFSQYAIPGEYYNGPQNGPVVVNRFGAPDETDRVVWRDYTPTRNPNQRLNITREAASPLFARPASRPTSPPQAAPSASGPPGAADEGGATAVNSSPANCVWAITGCCSQSSSAVRYSCFERYGCPHVFWDLNPCADEIRDSITNYLYEQFMN